MQWNDPINLNKKKHKNNQKVPIFNKEQNWLNDKWKKKIHNFLFKTNKRKKTKKI